MPSLPAKPLALGRTAEVYAWGENQVLKLYHTWCPPDWIENEERVAAAITRAGLPTPAAAGIIEVNGRRGILYERVAGPSMLQDMNAHPWRILAHARTLAYLQTQYWQISIPELHSYRDGLAYSIQRAPELDDTTRARLLRRLEDMPDDDSLCHGDFHPGNVMLTARGPLVIDWMTAHRGSPWADAARTSLLLQVGPKAAGKQLSTLTRLAIGLFHATYMRRLRQLRPDPQGELARWMPLIAAARLKERIAPETEALLKMIAKV